MKPPLLHRLFCAKCIRFWLLPATRRQREEHYAEVSS